MARNERHTEEIKIDQRPPIPPDFDVANRESPIVKAEGVGSKDYFDELAFMEEYVDIRVEPDHASERPNPFTDAVAVNGHPAEWMDGMGNRFTNRYIPRGVRLRLKRKYLGVLLSSKKDVIRTVYDQSGTQDNPYNGEEIDTIRVNGVSIFGDSPRGVAWYEELCRRYQ